MPVGFMVLVRRRDLAPGAKGDWQWMEWWLYEA